MGWVALIDHAGAGQFGKSGGQHQEIRHVVNVQQVVGFALVLADNPERGGQEKAQNRKKIGSPGFFLFAEPPLDADQVDIGSCDRRRIFGVLQGEDIDRVSPFRQGFGVAHDAGVGQKV